MVLDDRLAPDLPGVKAVLHAKRHFDELEANAMERLYVLLGCALDRYEPQKINSSVSPTTRNGKRITVPTAFAVAPTTLCGSSVAVFVVVVVVCDGVAESLAGGSGDACVVTVVVVLSVAHPTRSKLNAATMTRFLVRFIDTTPPGQQTAVSADQ
jgi:hypothetical protein